jgi:GH15 family glucan-1,4-alpha-glucosidase
VEELDASLLLGTLMGYAEGGDTRLADTVQRVTETLARGSFVLRYLGEDGLPGKEGAFLACSFWLVDALARQRRIEDASALMEQLLTLANDLGLYAEEIEPETHAFLGNFPQGLVHLGLVNAATSIEEARA